MITGCLTGFLLELYVSGWVYAYLQRVHMLHVVIGLLSWMRERIILSTDP